MVIVILLLSSVVVLIKHFKFGGNSPVDIEAIDDSLHKVSFDTIKSIL